MNYHKKINEHLTINYVELFSSETDADECEIPVAYEVSCSFHGLTYLLVFTTKALRNYLDGDYLETARCEGPSELFSSMVEYFEYHTEDANTLLQLIKQEWELDYRNDNVYNYLGIKENAINQEQ